MTQRERKRYEKQHDREGERAQEHRNEDVARSYHEVFRLVEHEKAVGIEADGVEHVFFAVQFPFFGAPYGKVAEIADVHVVGIERSFHGNGSVRIHDGEIPKRLRNEAFLLETGFEIRTVLRSDGFGEIAGTVRKVFFEFAFESPRRGVRQPPIRTTR